MGGLLFIKASVAITKEQKWKIQYIIIHAGL